MKLLTSGAARFGEPWRTGRAGGIVCDVPDGEVKGADGIDARAFYGGNLVAESISRARAERAIECVNFCAGFWFPPGSAYPYGLLDLVELAERMHRRLWDERGEPRGRYREIADRRLASEEFDLWRASYGLLRSLGRSV